MESRDGISKGVYIVGFIVYVVDYINRNGDRRCNSTIIVYSIYFLILNLD